MDKNMLNEFRRLSGQDKINESHLNEDEALNEGGIEFDLYEPSVSDNFKTELTNLLNRYLGMSNTDDFGTSNDNKMFVHKNLMDMVNNTFPSDNMRMSNENGVYYTNRPEEMSEFLKINGVPYKDLKSVR
tara:strand:- start:73 stop:462 length:390 start_codon:yes stop_codon:yes gene_type:complete